MSLNQRDRVGVALLIGWGTFVGIYLVFAVGYWNMRWVIEMADWRPASRVLVFLGHLILPVFAGWLFYMNPKDD